MEKELFVRAEEVARELGISKPYAYKLVREMNEELKTERLSHHSRTGEQALLRGKILWAAGQSNKEGTTMPAYKDKAKGTWYASFYYEDWTGKKVKKMKRGFPTKREALEWERTFLQQQTADLEMTFENFVAVYVADMKGRIKENTWGTKEHILYKKLVPYFGKRKMCDIHSKEVIAWQNEMLGYRDKNGKPYSPVYLKTLHNQLSAVFNHAVRHYNLKVNPAAQAGNMGKPKGREMLFWTKAEYLKFAEAMMDKPLSYYAFEMLYWCGVREGELLALTPGDFDFEKQTVTISKSYQRIKGKDVITDPKTPKSNRVIQMPAFLCEEMRDYIKSLYGVKPTDRIFTVTKSYLHREMDRGAKEAGVKRIRIHDLRHPYVKHTTKKYNSEKQKTQATKMDLIAWGFCFCIVSYSKRSWTL